MYKAGIIALTQFVANVRITVKSLLNVSRFSIKSRFKVQNLLTKMEF